MAQQKEKERDAYTRSDGGRNMLGILRDWIDGSGETRESILDKKIQRALDGEKGAALEIDKMKARQDKLAGISRRV